MFDFIRELFSCFTLVVDWAFDTYVVSGLSIGALLIAMNLIGLVGLYFLHRFK